MFVRKLNIIFSHRLQLVNAKMVIRSGHILRGKSPVDAKSLEQRLRDADIEFSGKIDIGFPRLKAKRSIQLKDRIAHVKKQRSNAELEKAARIKTLSINLEEVRTDCLATRGQFHLKRIADHFGIYEHLFGNAYFVPRVPLRINPLADCEENPSLDYKRKLRNVMEWSDGESGGEDVYKKKEVLAQLYCDIPILQDQLTEIFPRPVSITWVHKYTSVDSGSSLVHCGNVIKPFGAQNHPQVKFDGAVNLLKVQGERKDNYWSLLLTNPDGNLCGQDQEFIHWFISNIPASDITQGEEIVPYMQPLPSKGLGYQRFIFILYKQNGKLDLSKYKINESCDLEKRTFNTLEFYRNNQEQITPAGLAFFQSIWDNTVTEFYHKTLGINEPIYEYDFISPYIAEQKWFPLRHPFNLYMDKYRDPEKVLKEYLEKKLAKTQPFEGPEPPLRFPNASPISRDTPSWLKTQIRKDRLIMGRINDV